MRNTTFAKAFGIFLAFFLYCGHVSAQAGAPPSFEVHYPYDTGSVENRGKGLAPEVIATFPVHYTGVPWMRLTFGAVDLGGDLLSGTGSILRVTSHFDGAVQELDARTLRQWGHTTAYFNGDAVQVEILAWPGGGPNRVLVERLELGVPPGAWNTQCGPTDDRVLSNDPRAGRVLPAGCSGWMIDDCNTCLLSAGHCSAGIDVVQFNVPLSLSNGAIQHPPPSDQYSVDDSSLQSGNDWAYFGVFPNSTTGATALQSQGARYTLAAPPPVSGQTMRVTGYGSDSSPPTHNSVQQTSIGPHVGTGNFLQYAADTEGGNSGSPVIWEETGLAVAIHTNGGCGQTGGANSGTSVTLPSLQAALANPMGLCRSGFALAGPLPRVVPQGIETQVSILAVGAPQAGTVMLHSRAGGGAFQAAPMTDMGGGIYRGPLLPPDCDEPVEYYFSAMESCGLRTLPEGAPGAFFTSIVGTESVIFEDDFEGSAGWIALNNGATSGFWQQGVPVNDAGWEHDPVSDADGSGQCFSTQNQSGNTDVDDGAVQLLSPLFDMTAPGVAIFYSYFLRLTNENGEDRLVVELIDNSGLGSWVEVARHDTDGGLAWREHSITRADLIAAGVTPTSQMRLRFVANDGAPQSVVEAAVDAFRVSDVVCDTIGSRYCFPGISGAVISVQGSSSVSANDITLRAQPVPMGENGIFFYGDSQAAFPVGLGLLCVAPVNLHRLSIQNAGPSGVFERTLDLTQPPQPAGLISAGSTWNFQAWFRAGGTTDLSDAVSVTFAP